MTYRILKELVAGRGSHGRRHLCFVALALCAASLCSCSSEVKLHPVRGRVFVGDAPAEGSVVVFHAADSSKPNLHPPSAIVQADGSFVLSSLAPEDGAPAGNYVVAISSIGDTIDELQAKGQKVVLVPGRYGAAKTSPLTATVAEGANEIPPFKLAK